MLGGKFGMRIGAAGIDSNIGEGSAAAWVSFPEIAP